MKQRRTVLATVLVVVVLAACSATATVSTSAFANANCEEDLEVGAYLGGAGYAPEQTSAALKNALKQNPAQIQVDVRVTKDMVPVLISDANLKRTTNVEDVYPGRANDPINTFTRDELDKLDAGSWFDKRFTDEKILTLHDALGAVYSSRVSLSISPRDMSITPRMADAISTELNHDARWDAMLSAGLVEFGSPRLDELKQLHIRQPEARTLWSPADMPGPTTLKENGRWLDSVGQDFRDFNPEDAVSVHQADMTAALYGVDSPAAVTQALGSGADRIFTGFPDVLNAICADQKPLRDSNGIEVIGVVAAVDRSDVKEGGGEYVTLANTSDDPIDISGYYIRNSAGQRLHIGTGNTIAPGDQFRVYTAAGIDSHDRYYNGEVVNTLNNSGDTLAVYNPEDDCVSMFSY